MVAKKALPQVHTEAMLFFIEVSYYKPLWPTLSIQAKSSARS